MPRLDKRYTNEQIKYMVEALRDQSRRLFEAIGIIDVRMSVMDRGELFHDPEIKDKLTDLSITAQNLEAEIMLLWKRTRQ